MDRHSSQPTATSRVASSAGLHQSRRGFRELPSASVRVRGQNDLSYNPGKPLRLPHDRKPRRRPQVNLGALVRLLFPLALLGGLGLGVFFGIDVLLDDDPSPAAVVIDTSATGATTAVTTPVTADLTGVSVDTRDADGDITESVAEAPTEEGKGVNVEAVTTEGSVVPTTPRIITPADLNGAPVILERAAARPVPEGSVPAGVIYDPADPAAALSSVWAAGTVVELTRLPGAPLLSDEEAALFVGKTIRLTIVASNAFPEELQLSQAAYKLIAQEREPIIAVRIEAVGAPE